MTKKKEGRPPKITNEVLQILEEAFSIGASDKEACLIAGIAPATLYSYQESYPDFTERKALLKDMPKYKARKTIDGNLHNPEVAKWYLERKAKEEFSTRIENTGADGRPLNVSVVNYEKAKK